MRPVYKLPASLYMWEAEGLGKPDENIWFVGTEGGAEMLRKDIGTNPTLVQGGNKDEVRGTAVVAGP